MKRLTYFSSRLYVEYIIHSIVIKLCTVAVCVIICLTINLADEIYLHIFHISYVLFGLVGADMVPGAIGSVSNVNIDADIIHAVTV